MPIILWHRAFSLRFSIVVQKRSQKISKDGRKCRPFLDENNPYPVGHRVGARAPEVPVDDDHGDEDAHRVHDEGEQQILRTHTQAGQS
jgi:hypothetical protein